jgi:hypothetical protein
MKSDFEFLKDLAGDFFKQESTMNRLSFIYKEREKILDWEKWVQVEFAIHCQNHEKVASWDKEIRYELDKRISKNKDTCVIDFWVRQKHKQSALGIEFKQHHSPEYCIKAMMNDVVKVLKVKSSQDDLRSIWCLGIHKAESQGSVKTTVMTYAKHHLIPLDENLIHSDEIGTTGYSFTIF